MRSKIVVQDHIILPNDGINTTTKPPKAVVVVLGWWGSQMKYVQKYSKLYQDCGCWTITAILDSKAILLWDTKEIDQLATNIMQKLVDILEPIEKLNNKNDTKIPILFHAMSNGGGLVIDSIEQMIQNNKKNKNVTFLADRLQGQLFDSAPAFISLQSAIGAMSAAMNFNTILVFVFSLLIRCLWYIHKFIASNDKKNNTIGAKYWAGMQNSQSCKTQAYIYSTKDTLTDSTKLDELIEYRQAKFKNSGLIIHVQKFTNSDHVVHYRTNPKEYMETIQQFVTTATTTNNSNAKKEK